MLIVASKAKAYAKDKHDGMKLGTDFLEGLSEAVEALIDCAVEKAKRDKIGTVKKRHMIFQDPRAM